jgi:hypothetical protein
MKQNKDREEFEKKIEDFEDWYDDAESVDSRDKNRDILWNYFQSYTQKKVEEYKSSTGKIKLHNTDTTKFISIELHNKLIDKAVKETKIELLEEIKKKLIGKNEDWHRFINRDNQMRAIGRNRLKSKQRSLLKEML